MQRIEPTVGRVLHYHPAADHADCGQTLTALICKVNLAVFDSCGHQFSWQRVPLIQGDDEVCVGAHFCSWMPYQIGQARGGANVLGSVAQQAADAPADVRE